MDSNLEPGAVKVGQVLDELYCSDTAVYCSDELLL